MLPTGLKSYAFAILFTGICGSVFGAHHHLQDSQDVGLSITRKVSPTFPSAMKMQGVHSGRVSLVISVNAEGTLVDRLVVAYTHEGFVKGVLDAVAEWEFSPAIVGGVVRASRVELSFEFKNDLNVVVNNVDISFMTNDFFANRYHFRPYALKELDRIPTPTHVVKPIIAEGAIAEGQERVVAVEFYIDTEGRVRIPAIGRESANDELAAAAVAAVEQWRFEPPMRRGVPVLVRAQQEFRFVAPGK